LISNTNITTNTLIASNTALVNSLNSNTNVVATNLQSTGLTSVGSLVSNGSITASTVNFGALTATTAQFSGAVLVQSITSNTTVTANSGLTVTGAGATIVGTTSLLGNVIIAGNVSSGTSNNISFTNGLTVNSASSTFSGITNNSIYGSPNIVTIANQTSNFTLTASNTVDVSDYIVLNQTTSNITFTLPTSPTNTNNVRRILFVLQNTATNCFLQLPFLTTALPLQAYIPLEVIYEPGVGFYRIIPRATNAQVFTASGTYTPSFGMRSCTVEIAGGGGGSGGCPATGAFQYAVSCGGGGAGYAKVLMTAAQVGASVTVTVGSGGSGGVAGANAGTAGGTSTFGSFISAAGGYGGNAGSVSGGTLQVAGTTGGTVTVNTGITMLNITGQSASDSLVVAGSGYLITSHGGGSELGLGGPSTARTGGFAGGIGTGYGSGPAGVALGPSTAAAAGQSGQPGIIIVTEYF